MSTPFDPEDAGRPSDPFGRPSEEGQPNPYGPQGGYYPQDAFGQPQPGYPYPGAYGQPPKPGYPAQPGPYGQPFVQPVAVPQQNFPQNGLAMAGFVLGIISLCIALIPFGIFFIWPAGVLAIVFGAIGHSKANNGVCLIGGKAKAGWIMGILSLVVAPTLWFLAFASLVYGSVPPVGVN